MLTQALKRFAWKRIEAAKTRQFHGRVNAKVRAAYQSIVAQDPSRHLSGAQRKLIREYAKDVFGSANYAPWLEVYSAYRGQFFEGWIPENYSMKVLVPSWTQYPNIGGKTISRRILRTDHIPDLAYLISGFWMDREHRPLEASRLKDYLFADFDAVFVKADREAQGRGIWKITQAEFDPEQLSRLGNLVVQSPVQQHPFFDRYTRDSVATLRITTVKLPGRRAQRRASLLRFGLGGGAFIKSTSQIRVPVIDDEGTLGERGGTSSWTSFTAHPESHVPFAGERVPGFQAAVALCERLHDESPFTVLIGWDVAIDRDCAPVIMEWNQGIAGIAFSEASLGPCFKDLGWEDVWRKR